MEPTPYTLSTKQIYPESSIKMSHMDTLCVTTEKGKAKPNRTRLMVVETEQTTWMIAALL